MVQSKTEIYGTLEASVIIQLSFCLRWGLRTEWDFDKVAVMKRSMPVDREFWSKRLLGFAMGEVERGADAINKSLLRLPAAYRQLTFLNCARIVALKGFEEDITGLVQLRAKMDIEEGEAELLIDLAKQEAELFRSSQAL